MKDIDEFMFWSTLIFCVMLIIALALVFKAENNIMGPKFDKESEVIEYGRG
jgi:F0F1-type ATP synthase membrane subunit b/b'